MSYHILEETVRIMQIGGLGDVPQLESSSHAFQDYLLTCVSSHSILMDIFHSLLIQYQLGKTLPCRSCLSDQWHAWKNRLGYQWKGRVHAQNSIRIKSYFSRGSLRIDRPIWGVDSNTDKPVHLWPEGINIDIVFRITKYDLLGAFQNSSGHFSSWKKNF